MIPHRPTVCGLTGFHYYPQTDVRQEGTTDGERRGGAPLCVGGGGVKFKTNSMTFFGLWKGTFFYAIPSFLHITPVDTISWFNKFQCRDDELMLDVWVK